VLFYNADRIFDGTRFVDTGLVMVFNDYGVFEEFIPANQIDKVNIKFLEGILCPGFINVHGHIELSHMQGLIPKNRGFTEFANVIIAKRDEYKETIEECINKADLTYYQNGIVAAGDICNTTNSIKTKLSSKIYYHSFVELFSFNPEKAESTYVKGQKLLNQFLINGLSASITTHAPYSVSSKLFETITKGHSLNMPFSIHNQESQDENDFFRGCSSKFDAFYQQLGIDITWFKPSYQSSLEYTSKYLPDGSILVHNTFTNKKDKDLLKSNMFWCFSPNANLYIENKLPLFELFIED
jgi:cytosine/adenosine deaminase-related metal-dependent hydrolase